MLLMFQIRVYEVNVSFTIFFMSVYMYVYVYIKNV